VSLAEWIEAERGRFVLLLPIATGAAILVYFHLKAEPPLWLAVVLPAISLVLVAATWRWPGARFAALLLIAGALGFARAEWRTAALPPMMDVPHGAVIITGRIVAVDPLPVGRRVTLAAASLDGGAACPRALRIRLRNNDPAVLAVGDVVTLRARLFRPDRPAYPGAWDFGRQAFFEGLGASGYALGYVTVTQAPAAPATAAALRRLREAVAANISAVLPVATGSVAVTLLTGFSQAMPAAERQDFIAAGLAHILAVPPGFCSGAANFWSSASPSKSWRRWRLWPPVLGTPRLPARICRFCAASPWRPLSPSACWLAAAQSRSAAWRWRPR
jgi:competence protein ComEC